jgi:hypothetical protein
MNTWVRRQDFSLFFLTFPVCICECVFLPVCCLNGMVLWRNSEGHKLNFDTGPFDNGQTLAFEFSWSVGCSWQCPSWSVLFTVPHVVSSKPLVLLPKFLQMEFSTYFLIVLEGLKDLYIQNHLDREKSPLSSHCESYILVRKAITGVIYWHLKEWDRLKVN